MLEALCPLRSSSIRVFLEHSFAHNSINRFALNQKRKFLRMNGERVILESSEYSQTRHWVLKNSRKIQPQPYLKDISHSISRGTMNYYHFLCIFDMASLSARICVNRSRDDGGQTAFARTPPLRSFRGRDERRDPAKIRAPVP